MASIWCMFRIRREGPSKKRLATLTYLQELRRRIRDTVLYNGCGAVSSAKSDGEWVRSFVRYVQMLSNIISVSPRSAVLVAYFWHIWLWKILYGTDGELLKIDMGWLYFWPCLWCWMKIDESKGGWEKKRHNIASTEWSLKALRGVDIWDENRLSVRRITSCWKTGWHKCRMQ